MRPLNSTAPDQFIPRSSSKQKWHILLCLSTIFIASYHCVAGVSCLESELVANFILTHSEFALLSSILFATAVIGAFLYQYILQYVNSLYKLLTITCIIVALGQSIFVTAIYIQISSSLFIMYIGRIFIGFAYGLQTVAVFCIIHIWFTNTKWLPFAIYVTNSTFDAGVLFGRYCLLPFYRSLPFTNQTHNLTIIFSLGIILSLLSSLACYHMIKIEKDYLQTCEKLQQYIAIAVPSPDTPMDEFESSYETLGVYDKSEDESKNKILYNSKTFISETENSETFIESLCNIRYFSIQMWFLILMIVIPGAALDIIATQMTLPFMLIFNLSEWQSNMILSTVSILNIAFGFFWPWIASYGYLSYYLLSSSILYSLSLTMIYISAVYASNSSDGDLIIIAVCSMIIFSFATQTWNISSFPCLFISCPLRYISVLNTYICVFGFSGSMIESIFFGFIADQTFNYNFSILMMLVLMMVVSVIAIIIFVIDCKSNGALHKKYMGNGRYENKSKSNVLCNNSINIAYESGCGSSMDEKDDENDNQNVMYSLYGETQPLL